MGNMRNWAFCIMPRQFVKCPVIRKMLNFPYCLCITYILSVRIIIMLKRIAAQCFLDNNTHTYWSDSGNMC